MRVSETHSKEIYTARMGERNHRGRDAKAAARKRWVGASAGDVSEAGHKGPRGWKVART